MAEKEYIERGALIEEIRGLTTETWGKGLKNGWWSHSVQIKDNFLRLIEKSPAADVVEVRHGEWEQTTEPLGAYDVDCVECSICGESWVLDEDFDYDVVKDFWNYCPHCGAKMDGGKTE